MLRGISLVAALVATLALPTAALAWDGYGYHNWNDQGGWDNGYWRGRHRGHWRYHPEGHWDRHGGDYDWHDTSHYDWRDREHHGHHNDD
ncbi:MAG: hypothetical protein ACR65Z_05610 [Methylocystis sp.]